MKSRFGGEMMNIDITEELKQEIRYYINNIYTHGDYENSARQQGALDILKILGLENLIDF